MTENYKNSFFVMYSRALRNRFSFSFSLKIIYSCISTIFLIDINPKFNFYGFNFNPYKDDIILVYTDVFPNLKLTKEKVKIPFGFNKYTSLKELNNYNLENISKSKIIIINKELYWYEFFNEIDINATTNYNIYIKFNKDVFIYVYPYYGYLNILFELFFINPDNLFFIHKNIISLQFKKDTILYAKPISYIPITLLPGINNPIINMDYINSFVNFYNNGQKIEIKNKCYSMLYSYYINSNIEYEENFLFNLNKIKDILINKNYYTVSYIIDELIKLGKIVYNDDGKKLMYEIMYHIIINKNRLFQTNFKKYIKQNKVFYITMNDMNYYLLLYVFGKNIFIQIYSSEYINYIDKDYLYNKIKINCQNEYKLLKNKSDIYNNNSCICLYMSNPDPICFDTRCNNNNEYNINESKRINCKYPICSNGIDIKNLIINGTASFTNIITNTDCSNYKIPNDIINGYYYIYYINKYDKNNNYYWALDNNIIITTINKKIAFPFKITVLKDDTLRINNIYFKNSILTYNNNSYNDFKISLINNRFFLIDKNTGTPIVKYYNNLTINNILPNEINNTLIEIILEKIK